MKRAFARRRRCCRRHLPAAPRRRRSRPRKHVLAWADVRNGYQHDSISHAVATIERLGRESGAYDTFIRTDSQLITKQPIAFPPGTGIATGEEFNVHNLNYFDAIFFFGVREIDLSRRAARRSAGVRASDDGKGFVAAHSAATAFFSWPEFGEMLGGRFDEHPWNITDGTVVVDDPKIPAMRHMPPRSVFHDELYQLKDFSRDKIHVLAHLDSVEARSDGAAGAPQGRRFSRRVVEELRQGPRVLFDSRPRRRGLGQSAAAADVLPGDSLVASAGGVSRTMSKARSTMTALAVLLGGMWTLADQQPPQRRPARRGRGQGGRGGRGGPPRVRTRKAVLAWADTRNGIAQHDSVSHALAVIERLGYESGAYDTYIRTDSNIVANEPKMTTGAAGQRRPEPGERRRDLLSRPPRGRARTAAEDRTGGVRARRQGLRRRRTPR